MTLRRLSSRAPNQKEQNLRHDGRQSIEHGILPSASAGRKEGLMPFVEARYNRRSKHSDPGPAKGPLGMAGPGQGFAPGTKEEEAQQSIADNVPSLAEKMMKRSELSSCDSEQIMEKRIKKSARIIRRKIRGRLNANDDQPQDCGDPGF